MISGTRIVQGDAFYAKACVGLHTFNAEVRQGRVVLADSKAHKLPFARLANKPDMEAIDISWLPDAAHGYQLSSDYRDYVLWPVKLVHANVPNRWYDCFSLYELTSWSATYKMRTYATFKRAPMHIDHKHDDPLIAKGVIFDAVMRKAYDGWHTYVLQGFDRTKDPDLVKTMIEAPSNAFSMAGMVPQAICSIDHRVLGGTESCPDHQKGRVYNNRLAFEQCRFTNFFESSWLSTHSPANARAVTRESKLFLS